MINISKQEIANWLMLEAMATQHTLNDRLESFQKKYGMSFDAFEKQLTSREENFEWWDDYMAWKACRKEAADIQNRLKEIEHGDISVS